MVDDRGRTFRAGATWCFVDNALLSAAKAIGIFTWSRAGSVVTRAFDSPWPGYARIRIRHHHRFRSTDRAILPPPPNIDVFSVHVVADGGVCVCGSSKGRGPLSVASRHRPYGPMGDGSDEMPAGDCATIFPSSLTAFGAGFATRAAAAWRPAFFFFFSFWLGALEPGGRVAKQCPKTLQLRAGWEEE